MEQAREPMLPSLSLQEHASGRLSELPTFSFGANTVPPPRRPLTTPRDRLYDAPRNQPPPVLPDNIPPGSKLWEFNGQTYWLVPISPKVGK